MPEPASFINGQYINEPQDKSLLYFPKYIYGLKTTDPVYGGPWSPTEQVINGQLVANEEAGNGGSGISNRQAYELGLRTLWLKEEMTHSYGKVEEIYNNLDVNLRYLANYVAYLFQDLYANRIKNINVISTLKPVADPSIFGKDGNTPVPDPLLSMVVNADEDPPEIDNPVMPTNPPTPPSGKHDVSQDLFAQNYFIPSIVAFKPEGLVGG